MDFIQLPRDSTSHRHGSIEFGAGTFCVDENGSTTGTLLNNKKVFNWGGIQDKPTIVLTGLHSFFLAQWIVRKAITRNSFLQLKLHSMRD